MFLLTLLLSKHRDMKKIGFFCFILFIAYSCEDPTNECTECFSVKKNIETGAIEERVSLGAFCGQEIDSVLSIPSYELGGDYIFSYICQ